MARLRTKSGRLSTKERRRRIAASGAKPGEVVILDVTRRRERGVRRRNAISVDMAVETQWAADLDVRKLLHELRIVLAEHYRASLLAGQRADGRGPLPPLKRDSSRSRGVLTGEMANRWGLSKITGGPFRASTKLRPFEGGERAPMIARELRRGVDYQSVEGVVPQLIAQVVQDWLRRAVPSDGDGVGTPATAETQGGELPQLKK
jgi:hypothetical protein